MPSNLIHKMIILSYTMLYIICFADEFIRKNRNHFDFRIEIFLFSCYQFRIWVVFVAFFFLPFVRIDNKWNSFVLLLSNCHKMKKSRIDGMRMTWDCQLNGQKKILFTICGHHLGMNWGTDSCEAGFKNSIIYYLQGLKSTFNIYVIFFSMPELPLNALTYQTSQSECKIIECN